MTKAKPPPLNTEHFARCIETLENSLAFLRGVQEGSVEYEVYRNAVVKGFELTLETAGKLLRRALKSYSGAPRDIDALVYKDVIRHAGKHGLIDASAVQRWFTYRDNRNSTAHDYGKGFAEETLILLPDFARDARALEGKLREQFARDRA